MRFTRIVLLVPVDGSAPCHASGRSTARWVLPLQELALFHPAGHLGQPGNPFGKDIANAGLFRALARHGGYARVNVLNQLQLPPSDIAAALFPDGQSLAAVASAPLQSTDVPARGGVLLRGQPYLADLAWVRRSAARDLDYSLVGVVHTLAPPAIRELIGACVVAPVEPWDALICSSPVVQQAVSNMFESWHSYASQRYGLKRRIAPELALIPLAVDVDRLEDHGRRIDLGRQLRSDHGIGEQDMVALWVGRLSFYEKAFPQPMFLALEHAAQQLDHTVHFLMAGWFPDGANDRRLYEQAAATYAPSVRLVFLDGNDPDVVAACWPAADVFLSLVDNIQETFGLTPVEAMAAGMPVVVSDWDGYRSTVTDGEQGFLIPTLGAMGPQLGSFLANLHSLGVESYQTYVGAVAQHTAVDVDAAAQALIRLFSSRELRERMGASARERAKARFSWPVVVQQYNQLFERLTERRLQARSERAAQPAPSSTHPFRGDPFADFQLFATDVVASSTRISRVDPFSPEAVIQRCRTVELDRMFAGIHANEVEVSQLLGAFMAQPMHTLGTLQQLFAPERAEPIALAVVWLCKLGALRWDSADCSPLN